MIALRFSRHRGAIDIQHDAITRAARHRHMSVQLQSARRDFVKEAAFDRKRVRL
jgi:hypothetical protein